MTDATSLGWPKLTTALTIGITSSALLILGSVCLIASAFNGSYMLSFIGLGLAFWGALLLFLMPSKYVKLEMLTATSASSLANIERILNNTEPKAKGVYLPPKLLRDYESSLVFVPVKESEQLPKREEISEDRLQSKTLKTLFLTPPGLSLSKLLEKHLGKSFTETNVGELQQLLPKLFEELEITKNTVLRVEGGNVSVELRNHIFKDLCAETSRLKRTHETVGCPLASAIACALAKATGKPVTIEKEETSPDQTTTIKYNVLED